MKTILYATDYSVNSVSALHFAYKISEKFKTPLTVLHVLDVPLVLGTTTSITYARKEVKALTRDREKLKEFCVEHLGDTPDSLDIVIKIEEESTAWEGILHKAKEISANLIVVGAKGDNPLRPYVLGSTTIALIEKSDCPVLVIPEKTPFKTIESIVYASDLEVSDIFVLQDLVAFATLFDASIHLVHISNKDKKSSEEQMEWFKKSLQHKVSYEKLNFDLRFGVDVFKTLQNYINEVAPDMVAMLEREGHSLIEDLWHRDLVKRMKSEGHYPLLSFNKKNVVV
jgi:nucleotide-binding universal stress UspA family protein